MIRELHRKLTIDSVAIVISNNLVNLNDIPFPAVTVMSIGAFDWLVVHELGKATGKSKKQNGTINDEDFGLTELSLIYSKFTRKNLKA